MTTATTPTAPVLDDLTDVRFLVVYPTSAPVLYDAKGLTRYLDGARQAGEEPFAEEGYAGLFVVAPSALVAPVPARLTSGGMSAYDEQDYATFTMRVEEADHRGIGTGRTLAVLSFAVDGRS